MQEAVLFASHYESLVYFAHALEILLHAVLEDEADEADSRPVTPRFALPHLAPEAGTGSDIASGHPSTYGSTEFEGVLPLVVDFLDHFPDALQVVVGCARKTEVRRWGFLFDIVGPPRGLFEKSLERGLLKIAASYLLVLHNLDPLEQSSKDTIRLFKAAMTAQDWPVRAIIFAINVPADPSAGAVVQGAPTLPLLARPHRVDPSDRPARSWRPPSRLRAALFASDASSPSDQLGSSWHRAFGRTSGLLVAAHLAQGRTSLAFAALRRRRKRPTDGQGTITVLSDDVGLDLAGRPRIWLVAGEGGDERCADRL